VVDQGTERLVKVRFALDPKDWEGLGSESLWASQIAPGEYQIRNSPFYIYGISAEDIVSARDVDGILSFAAVSRRGGHSTYRILVTEGESISSPKFLQSWQPLQDLGCTYEQAKSRWLSVDVPPMTDIFAAYALLEKGEAAGAWTFEEAHCGHPANKAGTPPTPEQRH
jgi:hypothetical protein